VVATKRVAPRTWTYFVSNILFCLSALPVPTIHRALAKAYALEDAWVSDLKLKRDFDRKQHKDRLDDDQHQRAERAHEEALKQHQVNEYIRQLKENEISKNRQSRNVILKQRDEGTKRALAYKREKLQVIRDEKTAIAKKNRVKTVRRQRAIERNIKTHEKMTDRISRLLEYRNMYNSEMRRVYDDLSEDVNELRMAQRARNVFAAGESPAARGGGASATTM
jgi:hypothetical protein